MVTFTSYFGLLVVVLSRYTVVLSSTATPRLIQNIFVKEVRERKLMWCDSTTDSIVWMGEDERGTNLFLLTMDLTEILLIL